MATLRKKRKLAALYKENCEGHPRNNLAQNSNTPSSEEGYITQFAKEIEGAETKKLSRELSRTDNHFLGALSRLEDLPGNPPYQGTTEPLWRNSGMHTAKTRERMRTTPKIIHILKRAYIRARLHETLAPKTTTRRWQEFTKKSHTVPFVHFDGSKRNFALPINRKSRVKKHLRYWKQTIFVLPSSSWQTTAAPQFFITTLTEFSSRQSCSPQRCPRLTGNLRSLSGSGASSKRASNVITSWLKTTESNTSTLSWAEMRWIHFKTIRAEPERIWENI